MKRLSLILILISLVLTSCEFYEPIENDTTRTIIDIQTLFYGFQTESKTDDVNYIILSNRNEARYFLEQYLSEWSEDHILLTTNYSNILVIGAFTGAKPNNSYSIKIDSIKITRNTNQVFVTERGSSSGRQIIVWPAHFIIIMKEELGNRSTIFNLTRKCELEPCVW